MGHECLSSTVLGLNIMLKKVAVILKNHPAMWVSHRIPLHKEFIMIFNLYDVLWNIRQSMLLILRWLFFVSWCEGGVWLSRGTTGFSGMIVIFYVLMQCRSCISKWPRQARWISNYNTFQLSLIFKVYIMRREQRLIHFLLISTHTLWHAPDTYAN